MIVLTVDQVDSRHGADLVAGVLDRADALRAAGVVRGPDRTAGDEFQLLYADAGPALDAALTLVRAGTWTVGVGVGAVALPLPATTREAGGAAFSSARVAVEQATRSAHRLVVAAEGDPVGAEDRTALLHLLLEIRTRRSEEGWAVADLTADGLTQAEVARRQGVTPQAISLRSRAGGVRLDQAAVPALRRLLAALDARASSSAPAAAS